MWPNPQETEKVLDGKLHFLYAWGWVHDILLGIKSKLFLILSEFEWIN